MQKPVMRAALVTLFAALTVAGATAATPPPADDVAQGRAIAFDRGKGNCLACHTMVGSDVPSNVGPELSGIRKLYPDRKDLYALLFDEESRNPQTVMPAFGKNLILTPKEINQVIDFLYTL